MLENYKLLGDRIVVKPDSIETTTKSGIILAPTREKRTFTGTVLAVGAGKWIEDGLGYKRQEMEVKVNQKILFPRYTGLDFKAGLEETTLILSQRDILAIIE